MDLFIRNVIIGAGYSGILTQRKLAEHGVPSVIVDRGDTIRFNDSDFIIVCRTKQSYTGDPIKMVIKKTSSGSADFNKEYTTKIYGRQFNVTLGEGTSEEEIYTINNSVLSEGIQSYGNIQIDSIDMRDKYICGKVIHSGKVVRIEYDNLISTIPMYRFAKLVNIDLLAGWDIFISFFPIGVVQRYSKEYSEELVMEYVSDPLIPFYRKHKYRNTIFYEYCLNKKINVNFNRVVAPGKIQRVKKALLNNFYEFCAGNGIYFVGRFALWDPDFRIDHIYDQPEPSHLSNKFGLRT